jgi:localization factor PodJL
MTSGRTWSAKDLDPRTRRMAEEAARLSGMSLEDWLRETVAQRAAEDLPAPPARSRRAADDDAGGIADTLSRLGERIRSISPQALHVRDAAQQAELERITERLARDLQDIDEVARSRVEGRAPPREPPHEAPEPPTPVLEEALREIEAQVSALARRTREENTARREARYEALRDRLETPRATPPRRGREAWPPPDLDDTLRDIEAEVAASPQAPRPPAAEPHPEIPRAPPRPRQEAKSLSAAIADIASRQSFLSGRPAPPPPPPPEAGTPAAIGALRAEVAVLSDRIATLGERSGAERTERESAMARAEKTAIASQGAMSTIAATLGDIRSALVGLSARPEAPQTPAELRTLATGLDDLRTRLDGVERNGRQGTESLRRIEARVEAISRFDPGVLVDGIGDRLEGIAARIEAALVQPSRDGGLDELTTEIAAMRRDLASRDALGAEAIETRIRDLIAQIGATARTRDAAELAALEARIESLAADLARATPRATALAEMEQRLDRLRESLAEGRTECVEAAREAARTAVRDLGGAAESNLAGALRRDLDEIRGLIAASERTAALDDAVVAAKVSAAARDIDSLAAVAPPPPPPRAVAQPEPQMPRPRRDLGVVREVAASAGEDRGSTDRRADFIAAARRAVHIAMAETRSPSLPDDDAPALVAGAGGSPFARIGQAIRARRRTLLLAAAALVVAIGALQMSGRPVSGTGVAEIPSGVVFVNGTPAPPVAQVSVVTASAQPEDGVAIPVARPAEPSAPRQVGGVDPYVTGSTRAAALPVPDVGPAEVRAAAAAGDPAAAYHVANLYAEGRGTLRDLAQAAAWYQRAADAGMTPALYRLASLYERGQGVPKNVGRAVALYRAAAERGNPGAMYNLAVLVSAGAAGTPDQQSALRWFHAAAEHGVTDGQYNLGVIYARGIGVPVDREAAYRWFAIAAAAGDPDAAGQREQVAAGLSPAELARARSAAAAFVPRDPPPGASDAVVRPAPVAAGPRPGTVPAVDLADLPPDADGRRQMVRTVQEMLAARGYDPGPPDGLEGPQTRQAVRAFQRSIGAPGTGRIDGALVVKLAPQSG